MSERTAKSPFTLTTSLKGNTPEPRTSTRWAAAAAAAFGVLACQQAEEKTKEATQTSLAAPKGDDGSQHTATSAPQAESEETGKPAQAPPDAKECCVAKNDCKGKGGCAVDGKNSCAGKNDCKGKGGCNMHCPK